MNLKSVIKGVRVVSKDIVRAVLREVDFYCARPVTSTLFITYRCNSRCKTCTLWRRPQEEEEKKEIGVTEWLKIIDRLAGAGVKTTEIFGGNVLLRKDLLIQVLRHLDRLGFTVHLPTNQIGLDDDICKAIVEFVDYVYLSCDGVYTHQDMIRGRSGAAQRIDYAIEKLRRLRGDRCTPALICNTTVSRYNIDILDQIAGYALAKGFDEIHYEYVGEMTEDVIERSAINGLRPTPYYVRQEESVLVDAGGARFLKEKLRSMKKSFAGSGLKITTINIDVLSEENLYKGTIPHRKCYVERNEVTVDPYGNIVICPFINNYVMGNLIDEDLFRIWNNDRHRHFRALQNNMELEMCKHCILGVQRNPSFSDAIRRIYYKRLAPI